ALNRALMRISEPALMRMWNQRASINRVWGGPARLTPYQSAEIAHRNRVSTSNPARGSLESSAVGRAIRSRPAEQHQQDYDHAGQRQNHRHSERRAHHRVDGHQPVFLPGQDVQELGLSE